MSSLVYLYRILIQAFPPCSSAATPVTLKMGSANIRDKGTKRMAKGEKR